LVAARRGREGSNQFQFDHLKMSLRQRRIGAEYAPTSLSPSPCNEGVAKKLKVRPSSLVKIHSSGNKDGDVMVFIHGWPDSHKLWEYYVDHFGAAFRCVTLTLPGYDEHCQSSVSMDFDDVALALRDTLVGSLQEQNLMERQIVLCAHDWGCIFGYLIDAKYPGLFSKIIAMDVGPTMKPSFGMIWRIVAYQAGLIIAFFIGKYISESLGNMLARAEAKILRAPVALNPQTAKTVTSRMGYPYYYMWKQVLNFRAAKGFLELYHTPSCPILFMYAKQSPIEFFSREWFNQAGVKFPASKVVPIDSDHWFLLHKKQDVTSAMCDFLQQ